MERSKQRVRLLIRWLAIVDPPCNPLSFIFFYSTPSPCFVLLAPRGISTARVLFTPRDLQRRHEHKCQRKNSKFRILLPFEGRRHWQAQRMSYCTKKRRVGLRAFRVATTQQPSASITSTALTGRAMSEEREVFVLIDDGDNRNTKTNRNALPRPTQTIGNHPSTG